MPSSARCARRARRPPWPDSAAPISSPTRAGSPHLRPHRICRVREYARQFLYVLGDGRRRLPGVVALMFASAALDLLGLGLIVPLIIALGGAAYEQASTFPQWLPSHFLRDPWAVSWLCTALSAAFILKGWAAVKVQRSIVKFSDRHRADLMTRLMASYLAQ